MLRTFSFLAVFASAFLIYKSTSRHAGQTVFAGIRVAGTISPATPMLEPRSGHTATLLHDGRVLVAGGMRRNQDFYSSAELYDPSSKKFTATGSMNLARVGHVAVLLRTGKVLVAGGWAAHSGADSAELYDPVSGNFSVISKMKVPRGNPSATLLSNGDVLIAGGAERDTPGGVASAEIFHPDTSKFEMVSPMHFARISQTATLLSNGRVLIAGGRGDSVTTSAELYDPTTKQFTVTGSMSTARYKHSAGLLSNGRVLVAGGSDERDWNGATATAEIYDPQTGKFSVTSSLNESRFKLPDEAVRLASGRLLIAGGSKRTEVYDPATGTFFLASGEMKDSRHFMTETKLEDGSVLLAGGYPNNDQGTTDTWIYQP